MNALDLAAVRGNLNRTLPVLTAGPGAASGAAAAPSPVLPVPAAGTSASGLRARRVWDDAAADLI